MAKVGGLKLKDTLTAGEGATINDSAASPTTVYSSEKVVSLIPDALADLSEDATHRTVTDTEKSTWNAKAPALGADDNYVTDLEKAKLQQIIIFTYNL